MGTTFKDNPLSPVGKPGLPTQRHNELMTRFSTVEQRLRGIKQGQSLESAQILRAVNAVDETLTSRLPKDRTSLLIFLLLANLVGLAVLAILLANRLPVAGS